MVSWLAGTAVVGHCRRPFSDERSTTVGATLTRLPPASRGLPSSSIGAVGIRQSRAAPKPIRIKPKTGSITAYSLSQPGEILDFAGSRRDAGIFLFMKFLPLIAFRIVGDLRACNCGRGFNGCRVYRPTAHPARQPPIPREQWWLVGKGDTKIRPMAGITSVGFVF